MFMTGIPACDQLISVSFHGNIIPQIWYKQITKTELKNPKPHLLAINLLSDITYWYRPKEMRDEKTGQIIGYKKRFSKDLLQRSYSYIADQFGCSAGQAKDAIVFLEQLGVIKRVFRDMTVSGVRCNNILYIDLNVKRLLELTYPSGEISTEGVYGNFDREASEFSQSVGENATEPVPEFHQTNTENITTDISFENTPSINLLSDRGMIPNDGLNDEDLREEVDLELLRCGGIPYLYNTDERRMEIAIKLITDWYDLSPEHFETTFQSDTYILAVDCLLDMACADDIRTYKGSSVSYAKVIDKINEIVKKDKSLFTAVEEAIEDYIKRASEEEIRDKRKYMMSVIWNSFSTYRVKYESLFARTFGC